MLKKLVEVAEVVVEVVKIALVAVSMERVLSQRRPVESERSPAVEAKGMRPDIFFYPNDIFYGMPGLNRILLSNLFVYVLGTVWGIKNFISSLSYDEADKNIREFVFSLSLFVNLYAFVKIFPLKHLQYLIPVSPFVAFYFADLVRVFAEKAGRFFPQMPNLKIGVRTAIYLLVIGCSFYLSKLMYQSKSQWTNQPALKKLEGFLSGIPENDKKGQIRDAPEVWARGCQKTLENQSYFL